MVEVLKNAPPSFQYARFEKARTTRVEIKRARVAARMEELRREWPITGCMLQLDGWTNRQARPHINVMVSFPRGAVFWKSVCMSNRDKGIAAHHSILRSAIEAIGEGVVVGVIVDNAAICAAAGRMVERDYPHINSVPCAAHCLDLMFEAFWKIPWVEEALQRALDLAKFLGNHGRVHDLLHEKSNGKVVARPGATRFATNFTTVDSLQQLYLPLRSCVTDPVWKSGIVQPGQRHLLKAATDSILDDSFWDGIEKVQETLKELLALLKLVDILGPTISKVYGRLDVVVEKLRASEFFTDIEKDKLEEIVMRRWNTMNSPLHFAAVEAAQRSPSARSRAQRLMEEDDAAFQVPCQAASPRDAAKTITAEHVEQYRAARAKVIEPATKTVKRGRGRPRKAPVQQVDDAAAQKATNGEVEEGGGSGTNGEAIAPKRARCGQGRPHKSLKNMEEEEAAVRMASGSRGGDSATRDASEEDGSDSPVDRKDAYASEGSGDSPVDREDSSVDEGSGSSSEEEDECDSEDEPLAAKATKKHRTSS
ncbi:hypothetical protein CBR_g19239 [Chara braunii]|uniref:DUF659 domain-containing protein n=1 Tax=Chara braunii TaxID=69332 RepID=A0A388JTT0_CHABU|nr:hypothetical protein CBR_g19239 [Chara braunii]|eukprot:GBG61163.1 hypothetical protein CBR_g19239 [Chara braunii]